MSVRGLGLAREVTQGRAYMPVQTCAHGALEALRENPWHSAILVASQALLPRWTRVVCALS